MSQEGLIREAVFIALFEERPAVPGSERLTGALLDRLTHKKPCFGRHFR
jgi:hypothetical protein